MNETPQAELYVFDDVAAADRAAALLSAAQVDRAPRGSPRQIVRLGQTLARAGLCYALDRVDARGRVVRVVRRHLAEPLVGAARGDDGWRHGPIALVDVRHALEELGGAPCDPWTAAIDLGREKVEALRAQGRHAYLVEDVLEDIDRLLDRPDQPGAWTARLHDLDPSLGGWATVRAVLDDRGGDPRAFAGELENGLLLLRPLPGAAPPRWTAGDVIITVDEPPSPATARDPGPPSEALVAERAWWLSLDPGVRPPATDARWLPAPYEGALPTDGQARARDDDALGAFVGALRGAGLLEGFTDGDVRATLSVERVGRRADTGVERVEELQLALLELDPRVVPQGPRQEAIEGACARAGVEPLVVPATRTLPELLRELDAAAEVPGFCALGVDVPGCDLRLAYLPGEARKALRASGRVVVVEAKAGRAAPAKKKGGARRAAPVAAQRAAPSKKKTGTGTGKKKKKTGKGKGKGKGKT
jgi:hypothetical protein